MKMMCVLLVLVGLRQIEFGLRLCLLKALSKFILGHNKLWKNTFGLGLVPTFAFVEKNISYLITRIDRSYLMSSFIKNYI